MAFEKYSFDSDFQDVVIACFIRHPEKFALYAKIIEPAFFSGLERVVAARAIMEYFKEHSRFPTMEIFSQTVYDDLLDNDLLDKEEDAKLYVNKIRKQDTGDYAYILSKIKSFAVHRACAVAFRKALDKLQKGGEPDADLPKMFERALAVGKSLEDREYNLKLDSDTIIDKVTAAGYGTRTGFPLLDAIWPYGWGPGWLIVPLAPPKNFKTTMCINIALSVVGPSVREPVFYYPCEINQEQTALRAFANLTGIPFSEVFKTPGKYKKETRLAIDRSCEADFIMKSFNSRMATVNDIRLHAKEMQAEYGIDPKMIVIDHAECIKPSTTAKGRSDWREQGEIYVEARALGSELDCCVVMPDRCNRETVGRAVPDMRSFQGALEKAGHVDIGIGLCATEQERMDNVLRLFTFVDRHAPPFQHIRASIEPDIFRITLEEKIAYNPEETSTKERSYKKSQKKLKEDYD